MSEEADPENLADRLDRLEDQLADVQAELKQHRDETRGPVPSPVDLLRVADQHAIPGLIALLEAHIHALRLLQRTIRVMVPDSQTPQPTGTPVTIERAASSVADQLDRLIADLRDTTAAPEHNSLDPVIQEAREIRDELTRLADSAELDGQEDMISEGDRPDPDIDAELQSIKSELGNDGEPPDDDESADPDAGDGDHSPAE